MSVIINGTTGISTDGGSDLFGTGTIGGSLTLTSGTANGVTYLNGSKVLTSGSALTFDGTNLGVGTASSGGSKLAIQNSSILVRTDGDILKVNDVADTTYWFRLTRSGSDFELVNRQAGAIKFLTSDTEQMRLTSTGLGIGTSSPQVQLHIQSDAPVIRLTDTSANTNAEIFCNSAAGSMYLRADKDNVAANSLIGFQIDGSDKMTLDSAGNLGLGVTPSAWNDIYKVIQADVGSISSSSSYNNVTLGANVFYNASNSPRYIRSDYATLYAQDDGIHSWYTAPSGTAGDTIPFTQAMTLDASGRLGIGTTSPGTKLDVRGTANAVYASGGSGANNYGVYGVHGRGGYLISGYYNGTNDFSFYGNSNGYLAGNLGIGTSSPSSKLDVTLSNATAYSSGVTGNGLKLYNSSPTTGQYVGITFNGEPTSGNGGLATIMGTTTGSGYMDLVFSTRGSSVLAERLRIDSSGNVGIGTTSPAYKLDLVNANTQTRIQSTTANQNAELIFQSTARTWGIGTNIGTNTSFEFFDRTAGEVRVQITQTGALASYGQRYATWTETIATPDGGSQLCRFVEDCNGRYILVGRFSANAVSAIAGTWSSVRGLDTSLSQSTTTAFSADWGTSYPSEVRVLSASDFMRWGDTRGIDFIYRVPNGRQWQYFFNGGNTDGNYTVAGIARKGFNVGGCYDGKGRWNNPNCTQIGMSDADYNNPSSAYTTPTANAFNWYTAADAKLTAHATTGQYSGQDATWTVGFGYDDSYGFFCDEGFNAVEQGSAPSTYSTAVWILLKFDFASY